MKLDPLDLGSLEFFFLDLNNFKPSNFAVALKIALFDKLIL